MDYGLLSLLYSGALSWYSTWLYIWYNGR